MAIGQAAGTAAGLCALKDREPRTLDMADLQNHLIKEGASLHKDFEEVEKQRQLAQEAIRKALVNKQITGLHIAGS